MHYIINNIEIYYIKYHPVNSCKCWVEAILLKLDLNVLSRPLQLARYLNRTYWEKKEEARKSPTPSAPAPVPLAEPPPPIAQPVETQHPVPVQPVNIVEVGGDMGPLRPA